MDYTDKIDRIQAAVARLSPDATEDENNEALRAIRAEVVPITTTLAQFVNQLDDGNGYSNTTDDFVSALIDRLDEKHLLSLLVTLATHLDADELSFLQHTAETWRRTRVEAEAEADEA